MSRLAGLLIFAVAAACGSKDVVTNGSGGSAEARPGTTITLIGLAEMRGQIGPCGCTTDPLGDISRTTKLVADARAAGPTLVVDAGSTLYAKSPVPPHLVTQEELKADLLASTYRDALGVAALGLGPADLAAGAAKARLPRHAVNLISVAEPASTPIKGDPPATVAVEPPRVFDVGGVKVGVFGVIAEGAFKDVTISDPIAAGKAAAQKLRTEGARIVVGLVQAAAKKDAVKLVRDIGGIDIAIAGLGAVAPEPEDVEPEPQKVGDGWLIVPGNRGQVVSKLAITIRGDGGALVDAIGVGAAAAKTKTIDSEIAALDADIAKFTADPNASKTFIDQKKTERDALAKTKADLAAHPLVVPAKGDYFTLDQVRINKPLACDPKVQDYVSQFYAAAGKANVAAAANDKPPALAKGKAGYVGTEACADCHSDAVDFWKTTRHAHAWETLVKRGQEFDFDCIGCHVTGWTKPGGSTLAFNDNLRDVQCETCHGPGSIHVAKGGEEKPPALMRMPPDDLCATQCHTKEHSDTFEMKPYLRDIVGAGHGQNLRSALGDGPTGGQLRSAALAKAGRIGPGCVR